MTDLLAHATDFDFTPTGTDRSDPDTRHFRVHVSWRGRDRWAVVWMGECWNGTDWEYEPLNSSRDKDFNARTLLPLEEACRLAKDLADKVGPNGLTWALWQESKAAAAKAQ